MTSELKNACFTGEPGDVRAAQMPCWDELMKIDTDEPATLESLAPAKMTIVR